MKKWKYLAPAVACSIMLAAAPLMQAEEQKDQQQIFTDTKDSNTNANGNLSMPLDGTNGAQPNVSGMPGGVPGASQGVDSYDAVNTITTDTRISGKTISSTGKDENAILVQGGTAVIEDTKVSHVSDSSTGGDSSSFYGVGAAVLATDGTAVVKNSEISTDAAGGAGVFSYGSAVTYIPQTKHLKRRLQKQYHQ